MYLFLVIVDHLEFFSLKVSLFSVIQAHRHTGELSGSSGHPTPLKYCSKSSAPNNQRSENGGNM